MFNWRENLKKSKFKKINEKIGKFELTNPFNSL